MRSALALFLTFSGTLAAQITVVATTPTQAILTYTAPNGSACLMEVSESASYSPVVHDVDDSLFSGSNSDSRVGSINSGTARLVVIGKRAVETAADSKNYSRALQAITQHYIRVTCGVTILTGTFSTKNIPLGNTYSDVPSLVSPTISDTDRTQRIIDPLTGALIRRFSVKQDNNDVGDNMGPFMTNAGYNRMCGHQLVGPGPGYLCAFPNGSGMAGLLYYVIPSTGDVHYLGYLFPYPNPKVDEVDSKIYISDGSGHLSRLVYTGDYSENTPNTAAPFDTEVFTTQTPAELVLAYDPTFPTFGGNGSVNVSGDYAAIVFQSGVQDSYGSAAVLAMGNRLPMGSCGPDPLLCPHIIAATYFSKSPAGRFCGMHNVQLIPNQPIMNMEYHDLNGAGNDGVGGVTGFGPFYSTLTASIAPGATTITIDGEPTSPGAPDVNWQNATVGDTLLLKSDTVFGHDEHAILVSKTDSTHWVITRTQPALAFASGHRVMMECPANWLEYWRFLDDPTGMDATNTYAVNTYNWPQGGHDDWGPLARITEGYDAVKGPILTNLAAPINWNMTSSPLFAGVRGIAFGNSFTSHISYHQILGTPTDQTWFLDQLPFIGGDSNPAVVVYNPPGTLVSGQLWKTVMTPGTEWNPKVLSTFGVSGKNPMTNISGIGSSMGDTSADAYKFCDVRAVGECHAGSAVGEVYFNIPTSLGRCTPFIVSFDFCVGNHPVHGQGVVQLGLAITTNDRYSRVLTNGLAPYRNFGGYATAKALPDATWIMFSYATHDERINDIFLVKPPPYAVDSLDRSTFLSRPVSITTPSGMGITTAVVEYGYAEFGTPSQHYCTSRKEACVVVASSVTEASPFSYTTTDSYTRMACAASCTIPVPLLPSHVAYYTVKFYDGGGAFVTDGTSGVLSEPPADSPTVTRFLISK